MMLTLTHAYLLHLRLFMSKQQQQQQQQQALFVGPYKYIQYCKSYLFTF